MLIDFVITYALKKSLIACNVFCVRWFVKHVGFFSCCKNTKNEMIETITYRLATRGTLATDRRELRSAVVVTSLSRVCFVGNRPCYLLNVEASCGSINDILVDTAFLVDLVGVARFFHAACLESVDEVGVDDL